MTLSMNELATLRQSVTITHHIPGRIRLKFKSILVTQFAQLQIKRWHDAIAAFPAIHNFDLHSSSASLIIEYDPKLATPTLINQLFGDDASQAEAAYQQLFDTLSPLVQTGA